MKIVYDLNGKYLVEMTREEIDVFYARTRDMVENFSDQLHKAGVSNRIIMLLERNNYGYYYRDYTTSNSPQMFIRRPTFQEWYKEILQNKYFLLKIPMFGEGYYQSLITKLKLNGEYRKG